MQWPSGWARRTSTLEDVGSDVQIPAHVTLWHAPRSGMVSKAVNANCEKKMQPLLHEPPCRIWAQQPPQYTHVDLEILCVCVDKARSVLFTEDGCSCVCGLHSTVEKGKRTTIFIY